MHTRGGRRVLGQMSKRRYDKGIRAGLRLRWHCRCCRRHLRRCHCCYCCCGAGGDLDMRRPGLKEIQSAVRARESKADFLREVACEPHRTRMHVKE